MRDAALQRWLLAATIATMVLVAAVVVALDAFPAWRDAPLYDAGPGAIDSSADVDLAEACATAEEAEFDVFGERDEFREFDHARVARDGDDTYLACFDGGHVRLLSDDGALVDDLGIRARLGLVPTMAFRDRGGIVMTGAVIPIAGLVVMLLYLRLLRHATLLSIAFWIALGGIVLVYLATIANSVQLHDAPGLLVRVVATLVLVGMTALLMVDVRRAYADVGASSPGRAVNQASIPPGQRHRTRAAHARERSDGGSRGGRGRRRRRRARRNPEIEMLGDLASSEGAPPPAPPAPGERQPPPAAPAAPAEPIDVNDAAEQLLATLPGVNAVTARRIVERRLERGRIEDFDELCELVRPTRRVREQLEDRVRFGRGGVALANSPSPEDDDHDDPYGGRKVDL